jgi:hypothetical protein
MSSVGKAIVIILSKLIIMNSKESIKEINNPHLGGNNRKGIIS